MFSPDGHTALTGATDGLLILWNVDTGQPVRNLVGQIDLVGHIMLRKDGRTAITDGSTSGSYQWDTANGQLIRHLDGGQVFSPNEQTAFGYPGSTLGQNSAVLINLATGCVIRHFTNLDAIPVSSRFSPDGHSVLVGFSDGMLEEWRIDTLNELITWTHANRYIPELTCDQRELYQIEPLCQNVLVTSN